MFVALACMLAAQLAEPRWESWSVVGPWPVTGSVAEALASELPPEDLLARLQRGGDPDPRGRYRRDDGESVRWQEASGYPVDLVRTLEVDTASVVYLHRAFHLEQPGRVPVELTAAGAYRVWLNGALVAVAEEPVLEVGSTRELDLPAQAGRNHLLIKLVGDRRGCAFGVRVSFRWQAELAEMQGAIDQAIDRGVSFLLDRQMIDGCWGGHADYPGGITPVVLYALLKCGLAPEHPSVRRGFLALRRLEMRRTYSAGFTLLALAASGEEQHRAWVEELVEWLIESLPGSKVYGYPGNDDLSNHVVAVLGVAAAARRYQIDLDDDWWEDVLEGALSLQVDEERIVLPNGESGYQRGFTYRGRGEASGSMTSAGMTIAALALREAESQIGSRLRKQAERAIALGATWLANNWSVSTNPPNRSWHYFHLYGLERVGSLLERETFGAHPWYLEGARFLVDAQTGEGAWAMGGGDHDRERDTSMGLLFLKRATALAVTAKDAEAALAARSTADDQDVVLRASGDTPLTIWVADSRVAGTRAAFFASRVGEQLELNLGGGEEIQGRWTLRTQLPRPGRWELWCELDTPGGKLQSPRLEVAVRLVAPPSLLDAATAAERNLLLSAEDLSWRESTRANDGAAADQAADGKYGTGWLSAADDPDPWLLVEVEKGVRASILRFVPHENRPVQLGKPRPARLRVILNKRDVYELEVPTDPWEKAVLDLGKRVRIKQLEVHVLALHGATLGQASTGLCEIECEE